MGILKFSKYWSLWQSIKLWHKFLNTPANEPPVCKEVSWWTSGLIFYLFIILIPYCCHLTRTVIADSAKILNLEIVVFSHSFHLHSTILSNPFALKYKKLYYKHKCYCLFWYLYIFVLLRIVLLFSIEILINASFVFSFSQKKKYIFFRIRFSNGTVNEDVYRKYKHAHCTFDL